MQTLFGMLPNRGKTTPNVGSRDAKSLRKTAKGENKNIFGNFGFSRNEGCVFASKSLFQTSGFNRKMIWRALAVFLRDRWPLDWGAMLYGIPLLRQMQFVFELKAPADRYLEGNQAQSARSTSPRSTSCSSAMVRGV
jgi:hypothetical protein